MDCKHGKLFNILHLSYEHYKVELLLEKLTGGLPSHEGLIDAWMTSRGAGPVTPREVVQLTGEPSDRIADHEARIAELDGEEIEKTHTVVFYRDPDGRAGYEGRAFAGALKEAANILKQAKPEKGAPKDVEEVLEVAQAQDKAAAKSKMGIPVPNFRSKVVERVFVCERASIFPVETRICVEERPISVMTRQGPRTSLKRCEVAYDVPVSFTLHVLADGIVKPSYLQAMIAYSCLNGFGADRSQGSGRAELVDFVAL